MARPLLHCDLLVAKIALKAAYCLSLGLRGR